jgi:hypothetical protein
LVAVLKAATFYFKQIRNSCIEIVRFQFSLLESKSPVAINNEAFSTIDFFKPGF